VPALQPYINRTHMGAVLCSLLPERKTDHPLGCHRPRIPHRVLFEKLVEVLVFGCVPTTGSPTRSVRQPPCAVGARRVDRSRGEVEKLREMALVEPTIASSVSNWLS
jgi:hypothetical protein